MSHHVEVCSPAEAEAIIAKLTKDDPIDFVLEGHVFLTAREASGKVAWQHDQKNIITDFGRRHFCAFNFVPAFIVTSPSIETAALGRYALLDDGNASSSQASGSTAPTYDSVTLTKTWSPAAFSAPAANRQIGTVGLCVATRDGNVGLFQTAAFTVLTPVKTQTTAQTLEVVYKVTLTPIY